MPQQRSTDAISPSFFLSFITLSKPSMAAYAALVSLAHTTQLLLNSDKHSISDDEKAKITSISEYVLFLISFFEDFPQKSSRLEGRIRDIANEIEVIIEDFMWKEIPLSWWSTVVLSRFEFEQQLGNLTEEIGLIVGEIMEERFLGDPAATVSLSKSADTIANDVVIGLDDDLLRIKDRLCGESSKLEVISIVGMGGIGKTTLARNVYDDQLIVEYFHIRDWLTMSQDYSEHRILSSLVDSMKLVLEEQVLGNRIDECKMAEQVLGNRIDECKMAELVYKNLKGRRYLIVMDDVWSTKVWDDLKKLFPDDDNGSRIMLTTRLSDVGLYPNSSSPLHQMRFIDKHQSWDLLKKKVFTDGQDCPSELKDMGKEIALRCGGLPLAIVLVGGILSAGDMTLASWKEIANNMTSIVDEQLERIFSLSYKHLPQHLRSCFLFTGCFAEDYQIRVSRLIKLWIAEGFLKLYDNECKRFEDEAEEYLEDLVKRSLVLVVRRKSNGKIKSCSLHDLVRDLCIKKAQEEKFLLHVKESCTSPEIIKDFRFINLVDCHLDKIWGPTIRSMSSQKVATSLGLELVGNFKLLRVFDVMHDEMLPSQLFELFHLRYLALTYFVEIPSSISNLENLQTLIIGSGKTFEMYPQDFSYLPLEIWRMPRLRHLVFSYYYILLDPPDDSTLPLKYLQTLSGVANLVCSERILKLIPNLKKLGIVYFKNDDYNLHNLIHLCQLEKLKLTRHEEPSWLRQNPTFPLTLKKLTLYGGKFSWKHMGVFGALPNLEVLKLRCLDYDGVTWKTTDGEFLHLKFLLIKSSNLQHWITETSHFPRLKRLVLHSCQYLRQIPEEIGEIPTLELIEMKNVKKSLVESAKQIQEDQLENYGNDTLQVRWLLQRKEKESKISPSRRLQQLATE